MTNDTDPITLKDAAQHFGLTVLTLRAEHDRGRLTLYKIGRRLYTTPADVRAMIQKCRVEQKARGYTSIGRDPSGSFETARISAAQDALRQTINARKSSSLNTSRQSTSPNRQQRHS
jgi:hypothetical protein